jgi:uncharacterized protein GlcG (DUF336 family)
MDASPIRTTALCIAALLASAGATAQPAASSPLDVVPEKIAFDIPYGTPIALERAEVAIAAAIAEAKRRDWKMGIAIVDGGGNLVAFQRMDGSQMASIAISQHKARAAAAFRRETKAFETGVQSGNTYQLTLDGMIAARGGIPIVEAGKLIGAIGCSGGTGSQDEVVCKAGAATIK